MLYYIKIIERYLLGNKNEFSYEQRFVITISLLAFLASLFATTTNIVLELGRTMIISTIISALAYFIIYSIARFIKAFEITKLLLIIFSCIILSFLWFKNAGSYGPISFIFFNIFLLIILLWEGLTRKILLIGLILNLALLFYLEVKYPQLINTYPSETGRIFDLFSGVIIFFVIGSYILVYIKHNYIREKKKAEESDLLKTAFLANMGHEIRTPMNSIVGFSNLILKKKLSTEKHDMYLKIINSSSKYLIRLIEDIIDISKIESNQLTIQEEEFYLDEILNSLELELIEFKKRFEKDNVHLIISKCENCILQTDKTRLKQILINLANNAIKFTHKGYVKISSNMEKNKLIFTIEDTGIGMKEEEQEKIFERFYKIHNPDNELLYAGTGIGLSITQRLVELMGGTLSLESEYGKGSNFIVQFPANMVKERIEIKPEIQSSINTDWNDKTILIGEDDNNSFFYLSEILKPTGINIIRAFTGKDCIQQLINNKSINISLLDIKMPLINGVEVVEKMKEYGIKTPFIAQTAFAMAGDKQRYLNAGFIDYISKPISEEELINMISKYL